MRKAKRCSKCGVTKPLSNYHRSAIHKDGRRPSCKSCRAIDARSYAQTASGKAVRKRASAKYFKTAKGRLRVHRCNRSESHKRAVKKYAASEQGRRKNREQARKYRAIPANRHKDRIRAVVNKAVQLGKIPRAKDVPCAHCGKPAAAYHHHSYDRAYALDVTPLCRPCHYLTDLAKKK